MAEKLEDYWRTVRVNEASKAGIRRVLAEDLEDERQESEIERRSQERIIQRLKDERKNCWTAITPELSRSIS